MTMIRCLALLGALLFAPLVSQGATYYFAECGVGASGSCVAGNDANSAAQAQSQATPWKTCDKFTSQYPSLNAGDVVLFAKGGAWDACRFYFLYNTKSTRANPIRVGMYDPGWSANKPRLNGTTTFTIKIGTSSASAHQEGLILEDLNLVGPGVGTAQGSAVKIDKDSDWVTLRRLEISGFKGGVYCDSGHTTGLASGNGLSEFLTVRDSYIHDNHGVGILSSCSGTLIENNTFNNSGVDLGDHHIYIDDSAVDGVVDHGRSYIIRGNTMTNNTPYANASATTPTAGGCKSVAVVIHGKKDGILIENNLISEPTVPTSTSCWGISADSGYSPAAPPEPNWGDEGFTNVVIRGNTVINYSLGIGLDLCQHCTVENNHVYSAFPNYTVGIRAPRSKNFVPGTVGSSTALTDGNHLQPSDITVRNNTVYLAAPDSQAIGIAMNANIGDLRTGSNYKMFNNAVYFAAGTASTTACFDTRNIDTADFAVVDYNACYYAGTAGKWDIARSNLAADQAVGFNAHAVTAAPGFTAPATSPAIPTGSPLKNAGRGSECPPGAWGGVKRDQGTCDIGAYEFGATTVLPGGPSRISINGAP